MAWDPQQYAVFADHRLRPALDLLARVPPLGAETVVDLGCGSGAVTAHLARRWPEARLIGVDSSVEMLAAARDAVPDAEFVRAEIDDWKPEDPVDVIYSNAALHWLPDHAALFPRLLGFLKPGGVLAVQMPRNFGRPSHRCVEAAAADGPWRETLEPMLKPPPTQEPAFYYDLLAGRVASLDIWETDYIQALEGENPVAEWTKGTWLRPFLAALAEPQRSGFEDAYRRRILAAYPKQADEKTLLPFLRLFLIATASTG